MCLILDSLGALSSTSVRDQNRANPSSLSFLCLLPSVCKEHSERVLTQLEALHNVLMGLLKQRSQTHHLTPGWVRQLSANDRQEFASQLFALHFLLCHNCATVVQKIPWARGRDYECFPEAYGILLRSPGCLCPCLYFVQ